jgi:hypothetical protein
MPSKLDPHVAAIKDWLAAEPQLTAIAIVGRLSEKHPDQFGAKQHSIVQRLLKALRKKAAEQLFAQESRGTTAVVPAPGGCGRLGLWRAQPAHSPSHRARFEISALQSISHRRIVTAIGATWVTFSDEAIRGVPIKCRLTIDGRAWA